MALPDPAKGSQLVIFSGLKKDPVIASFFTLLLQANAGVHAALPGYMADFVKKLYNRGTTDWSLYLKEAILQEENCLYGFACRNEAIPDLMLEAMKEELDFLQKCCEVKSEEILADFHARWNTSPVNLTKDYFERLLHFREKGAGDFARYSMFRLADSKRLHLIPVQSPDEITFDKLYYYQDQHQKIKDNTAALMEGLPANNVLLYGAAGTGKSASIKAALNTFKEQGLRLIQIDKEHLELLPALLDKLSNSPLKFIVFIDDLSFNGADDRYPLLKAVLEGSASRQSGNTLIYATSNRRHIVKESEAERSTDLHLSDHLEELGSLADRFGLQLLFNKPSKEEFSHLVYYIGRDNGLELSPEEISKEAERYVLGRNGRSPRAAKQFVLEKKKQRSLHAQS